MIVFGYTDRKRLFYIIVETLLFQPLVAYYRPHLHMPCGCGIFHDIRIDSAPVSSCAYIHSLTSPPMSRQSYCLASSECCQVCFQDDIKNARQGLMYLAGRVVCYAVFICSLIHSFQKSLCHSLYFSAGGFALWFLATVRVAAYDSSSKEAFFRYFRVVAAMSCRR